MQKRARSDSLTGGTDDVNPQFLSGALTLSAANTVTEVAIGTPIVRVGAASPSHAVIMEILKIYADLPVYDQTAAGATTRTVALSFTTASTGATPFQAQLDNTRCFASFERQQMNAFTAAGTGILQFKETPMVFDLTDGAGHGVLIATDNIFVQGDSAGQAAASVFRFKILYRFKKVSLVEYIGIVQSQQ
jgi:hypothetical protein